MRLISTIAARLHGRDRQAWTTVFLCCLPVYLLTGHYSAGSVDTASAVWPAWQLVHHGNLFVEHLRPRVFWSVPVHGHLLSNRMPGTELVNVPALALLFFLGPNLVAGAVTAAALTAATVATLFVLFRGLTTVRRAATAAVVAAFGTSLWSVASTEIWTHTVNALLIALAMLALSRGRQVVAGACLGAAITARPQIAVIAAVVGTGLATSERSWKPLLRVGIPAVSGLVALLAWNHVVFGGFSVSGGYGSYAGDNLTSVGGGSGGSSTLTTFLFAPDSGVLPQLGGLLLSPQRGLLVFTPLALLLLCGVRTGWREAPAWVRVTALAGIAYTLVQLRINAFTGGDTFYGYRLAIELVVCLMPLGVVVHRSWVPKSSSRVRAGSVLAVTSILIQAIGALLFDVARSSPSRPWRASGILDALAAHPLAGLLLLAAGAAAVVAAAGAPPRGPFINRSGDARHADRPIPAAVQGTDHGRAVPAA